MSTRSTTHFIDSHYIDPETKKPHLSAIIYRHIDGYPEGAGRDLFRFLQKVNKLQDNRLNDSSYLAAKYVVFLAQLFERTERLDFLSVGIVITDPEDIEFRYTVDCGKINDDGFPEVKCFDMNGKEHDIP